MHYYHIVRLQAQPEFGVIEYNQLTNQYFIHLRNKVPNEVTINWPLGGIVEGLTSFGPVTIGKIVYNVSSPLKLENPITNWTYYPDVVEGATFINAGTKIAVDLDSYALNERLTQYKHNNYEIIPGGILVDNLGMVIGYFKPLDKSLKEDEEVARNDDEILEDKLDRASELVTKMKNKLAIQSKRFPQENFYKELIVSLNEIHQVIRK